MLVRRLVGAVCVALVGFCFGCTSDDTVGSSPSSTAVTSSAAESNPSSAEPDPTSIACAHFTSMWREFAQLDMASGRGPWIDPHSAPATAETEAALAAAENGPAAAQLLGELAHEQCLGHAEGITSAPSPTSWGCAGVHRRECPALKAAPARCSR